MLEGNLSTSTRSLQASGHDTKQADVLLQTCSTGHMVKKRQGKGREKQSHIAPQFVTTCPSGRAVAVAKRYLGDVATAA